MVQSALTNEFKTFFWRTKNSSSTSQKRMQQEPVTSCPAACFGYIAISWISIALKWFEDKPLIECWSKGFTEEVCTCSPIFIKWTVRSVHRSQFSHHVNCSHCSVFVLFAQRELFVVRPVRCTHCFFAFRRTLLIGVQTSLN